VSFWASPSLALARSTGSGTAILGAIVVLGGLVVFIASGQFKQFLNFWGVVTALFTIPNILIANRVDRFSWTFVSFSLGLAFLFVIGTTVSAVSYARGKPSIIEGDRSPTATKLVIYVALSAFFTVFSYSYAYFSYSQAHHNAFERVLSRLDAIYFAIGNLSTAGAGGIAAKTEASRALAISQLVADIVLVSVTFSVVVAIISRSTKSS
jgi:hypothetical protein